MLYRRENTNCPPLAGCRWVPIRRPCALRVAADKNNARTSCSIQAHTGLLENANAVHCTTVAVFAKFDWAGHLNASEANWKMITSSSNYSYDGTDENALIDAHRTAPRAAFALALASWSRDAACTLFCQPRRSNKPNWTTRCRVKQGRGRAEASQSRTVVHPGVRGAPQVLTRIMHPPSIRFEFSRHPVR
jgi:hypothetical protein